MSFGNNSVDDEDFSPINLDIASPNQSSSSHAPFSPSMGLGNVPVAGPNLDIFGPTGPEFLVVGDAKKTRSTTESLFFYSGSAYLIGSVMGGTWGAYGSLVKSTGQPFKLRANAVSNASVKTGTLLGGNLGILGEDLVPLVVSN
mmetsp:Transcript_46243/g.119172  ORF Transcript_46243/g.119172 Transcript_46243/m.119172 type:complete len:144 (-) Transcript_46243:1409-1840(-)